MNNTLTKETSQKIKELGVESDFYWFRYIGRNEKRHGKFFLVGSDKRKTTTENGQIWGTMWKEKWYEWYPALSFSELLLALKEIGEKKKWGKICPYDCGIDGCAENPDWRHKADEFLDVFLKKGMAGVDKYISELLK